MSDSQTEVWSADPTVLSLIAHSSRVRASVPLLFSASTLAYITILSGSARAGALTILGQLTIISTLAHFRARVPRKARPCDYDDKGLRILAYGMKTPLPKVMLLPSTQESVRVRGSRLKPVILISTATELLWRRDPGVHSVQLTHEMGHVWFGDVQKYYFRSTAALFLGSELLASIIVHPSNDKRVIAVATLASIAGLAAYLRSREHAADFLAAQVHGARIRDAFGDVPDTRRVWLPFLRTHPTPKERRLAFSQPERLFVSLNVPMFGAGFLGTWMTDLSARVFLLLTHTDSLSSSVIQLIFTLSALSLGIVTGGAVAFGISLDAGDVKAWLRALLLGAASYILLQHHKGSNLVLLTICYVLVAALTAKLAAGLGQLLFFLIAPRDPDISGVRLYTAVQSLLPATAWILIAELAHANSLGRIIALL